MADETEPMNRVFLKSKLHRVTVTRTELDYEGSCAIDALLLEAADIREYEQVDVYDVNNGERFTTYAVAAPAGSGTVSVMGAAARLVHRGDRLIVCAYAALDERELAGFKPRVIQVDDRNRVVHSGSAGPPP